MYGFSTGKELTKLKAEYPVGTRIVLVKMDDPQAPREGTCGTVTRVDDAGSIHVNWDNGSTLALIPGVDGYRKEEEQE